MHVPKTDKDVIQEMIKEDSESNGDRFTMGVVPGWVNTSCKATSKTDFKDKLLDAAQLAGSRGMIVSQAGLWFGSERESLRLQREIEGLKEEILCVKLREERLKLLQELHSSRM